MQTSKAERYTLHADEHPGARRAFHIEPHGASIIGHVKYKCKFLARVCIISCSPAWENTVAGTWQRMRTPLFPKTSPRMANAVEAKLNAGRFGKAEYRGVQLTEMAEILQRE